MGWGKFYFLARLHASVLELNGILLSMFPFTFCSSAVYAKLQF